MSSRKADRTALHVLLGLSNQPKREEREEQGADDPTAGDSDATCRWTANPSGNSTTTANEAVVTRANSFHWQARQWSSTGGAGAWTCPRLVDDA